MVDVEVRRDGRLELPGDRAVGVALGRPGEGGDHCLGDLEATAGEVVEGGRGLAKTELGGVVEDPWGNVRFGFTATGTLDRSEFGLTWNAVLEGGGVVVGDWVRLNIDAEFVRPAW